MKQATVLFLIVLFVPTIFAFFGPKPSNVCHYKSTKGVEYDLRLLNNTPTDLQYFDTATQTTFYFSPCGVVTISQSQPVDSRCPKGSSMCMVNTAGKSVNFGTVNAVQFADGAENGASIEAVYGNGELCNNGIARKTIVEYVCNLNKAVTASAIKSVTMIDDCTVQMIIESPYACPVKQYCESLSTSDVCANQDKLCVWSSGKCVMSSGCAVWRHFSEHGAGGVAMIVIFTCVGAALACTCGLCVCCCLRRKARKCRMNGNRKCMLMRRCNKKNAKTANKKKVVKKQEQEVEYAPFQMPVQLIPGGFAPVNPYSNIQGYPMVTLVAPTGEEEQV